MFASVFYCEKAPVPKLFVTRLRSSAGFIPAVNRMFLRVSLSENINRSLNTAQEGSCEQQLGQEVGGFLYLWNNNSTICRVLGLFETLPPSI